jgi:outer membrane protein W
MKHILAIALLVGAGLAGFSQSVWNLTYDMSLPMGATKDFVSKTSYRGFGIDGRQFINDNITLGGSWSWNVFYEKSEPKLESYSGVDIYGVKYSYSNVMPFLFTSHYYFGEDGGVRPFIGTGIGTNWKEDYFEKGALISDYDNGWQFTLAPEVGIYVPVGFSSLIFVNAKYTYGFETGNVNATSYLNVGVGFAWENF